VVSEYTVAPSFVGLRAATSWVDEAAAGRSSKRLPHWMQLLAPTKMSARHLGQQNLTASVI
jgi:hypothetical protein